MSTIIRASWSGKWMMLLSGVWLAPCHASSIRSPPIFRVRLSLNAPKPWVLEGPAAIFCQADREWGAIASPISLVRGAVLG
jgi:hypothetical protein